MRGRRRTIGRAGAVLALAAAVLGCVPLSTATPTRALTVCTSGAALVAVPVRGTAPLLSQFTVEAPFGENTTLAWAFGDGSSVVGSGAADSRLVHEYVDPGTFSASVTGSGPLGSFSCSVGVTVLGSALTAHMVVLPGSGSLPLTVHVVGAASGGTGTFVDFSWSFGDGDFGTGLALNYTYSAAGTYPIVLQVRDSSGATATASATVTVTAPTSTDGGSARPGSPIVLTWGAPWTWGVAVGLVLVVGASWWGYRRAAGARAANALVPSGAALPVHPPPAAGAIGTPAGDGAAIATEEPSTPAPGVPTSSSVTGETLRMSRRILLHLARLGPLETDGVAPVEHTQRGLVEALAVRQGPLSNVLRRLVAAGLVTEEIRYVAGSARRLKAYRLTPEGAEIAARARQSEPPGPSAV